MKTELYIDSIVIGTLVLRILDESMGVVGGQLIPNENYKNFREDIQENCAEKGISNSDNFNFKTKTMIGKELMAEGGIGVTDIKEFDGIEIEVCGLNSETIEEIKNCP
jgi:hypothetical protein